MTRREDERVGKSAYAFNEIHRANHQKVDERDSWMQLLLHYYRFLLGFAIIFYWRGT